MRVKMIQVIEATGLVGVGTKDNPHREVTAYFLTDGTLLFERDPIDDIRASRAMHEQLEQMREQGAL